MEIINGLNLAGIAPERASAVPDDHVRAMDGDEGNKGQGCSGLHIFHEGYVFHEGYAGFITGARDRAWQQASAKLGHSAWTRR